MQLQWIEQRELESLSWVSGRNKFADQCSALPVDEILKKYVYLSATDAEYLLNAIKKLHGEVFKGVGIELGAGVAIFSAILSKMSSVACARCVLAGAMRSSARLQHSLDPLPLKSGRRWQSPVKMPRGRSSCRPCQVNFAKCQSSGV